MAAAAEGLGGLTAVKAAADALGPGRVENVVQALVENVAQGQPALAVQTAGDHGAVAQHAQLAAQAVAVLGVVGAVVVLVAGPVEVLVLLYVDAGGQAAVVEHILGEVGGILPGELAQDELDLRVQGLGHAAVPQAQGAVDPSGGQLLAAAETAGDVVLQGHVQVVALEGMERDGYLMQGGAGKQDIQLFGQERAVGGDADTEVQLGAGIQNFPQLRVEQRLAHNVEVDILRDSTQLFGRHRKVVGTHGHQRPVVAGAEVAVEVAEVGDLHIGALDVHGRAPLSLSCRAGVPARTVLWQHCITSRGEGVIIYILPPPVLPTINRPGNKIFCTS